jgi:hypothetical protein
MRVNQQVEVQHDVLQEDGPDIQHRNRRCFAGHVRIRVDKGQQFNDTLFVVRLLIALAHPLGMGIGTKSRSS